MGCKVGPLELLIVVNDCYLNCTLAPLFTVCSLTLDNKLSLSQTFVKATSLSVRCGLRQLTPHNLPRTYFLDCKYYRKNVFSFAQHFFLESLNLGLVTECGSRFLVLLLAVRFIHRCLCFACNSMPLPKDSPHRPPDSMASQMVCYNPRSMTTTGRACSC